ncbi:MAG: cobalt ECF transporter T component CbiQ [Verrucomicrobiales bacterium]|nr:cobalt ECF transporter T component CbiQ [Verrucomicrobiota bacterium JB025]
MSLLSELFSDLFASRDNVMTRLDPRVKVVAALALLVGVVFATSPVLPLALFVGCAVVAGAGGVPIRFIGMRLAGPLAIAGMLLLLQGLLTGTTPLWSFAPFGMRITITAEGWRTGVVMASRVLGGTGVMLLLSAVTPAHRIFLALRSMGVSKGWVEIAMLMYRYIFVLLDLTADVASAQRLRLGYSSVRRGMSSAGVVAGVVVLRAVDQAVRTNEAMRVRGYRGEIPTGVMRPLTLRDWLLMTAVVVAMGAAHILTEWNT